MFNLKNQKNNSCYNYFTKKNFVNVLEEHPLFTNMLFDLLNMRMFYLKLIAIC